MDDEYLFDEFAQLKGLTRLDRSKFPKEAVAEYDRYLGRAKSMIASALAVLPKMPKVYVEFVASPEFNAYAKKYEHSCHIAFFAGLPAIVATIINRMLADSRIFPDIGNPKEENSDLPVLTGVVSNAVKLYESNRNPVVPKNAHRLNYASHLCNLVFDFLAAHELAHITKGHAGYTAFAWRIPCMKEFGSVPSSPDAALESQAMEMDADFTAAFPMVTTLRKVVSDHRAQLPEPIASRYKDPGQAIFDLGTAICIIFRLFSDSEITNVDLATSSHPPNRLRQFLILRAMGTHIFEVWDRTLFGRAEHEFSRAIDEVERAFELITGRPRQVEGLHELLYVSGPDHAAKFAAYWNNTLRGKMEEHAFAKLPPYGFDKQ
jgi:hypothetical protein